MKYFRLISINYEWYDEIDANGLEEAYKGNGEANSFLTLVWQNPGAAFEVILGDWIGDKLLGGYFYIVVTGKYDVNGPTTLR